MTPRVVRDDETGLDVEESHLGRASLCIAGLLLCSGFLIPATQSGSLAGLVIGVVLASVVVVLPFLLVLWRSSYRRLEVRHGGEIVSVVVYRVRPPRTVRIPWAELDHIVCERVEGGSESPDWLYLKAYLTSGKNRVLLRGWYSEDLVAVLERHLEGKFSTARPAESNSAADGGA